MHCNWPYSLMPLGSSASASVDCLLRCAIVGLRLQVGQSTPIRKGDCPLAGKKRHRRFVPFRLALQRRSVRAASHGAVSAPSLTESR